MKDGFLPVAAVTPEVRVADVDFNVASIEAAVRLAADIDHNGILNLQDALCLQRALHGDYEIQQGGDTA